MVSPLCSSVYGSFTFFRCDSLSPTAQSSGRIHWREADSRILIHKYVSARLYLNWSDHISRVASLDLDAEEDIRWGELIDADWNKWTAPKLEERWAALKSKVGASATHRGEYRVHFYDTLLMISCRHHQAFDESVLKSPSSHVMNSSILCSHGDVYIISLYKLPSLLYYQSPLQIVVACLWFGERPIDRRTTW